MKSSGPVAPKQRANHLSKPVSSLVAFVVVFGARLALKRYG